MLDRQTQVRVAVGFGALALALGGVLLATTRPRDRGTAGSDTLDGGAGNDTLVGGS